MKFAGRTAGRTTKEKEERRSPMREQCLDDLCVDGKGLYEYVQNGNGTSETQSTGTTTVLHKHDCGGQQCGQTRRRSAET